ncbi:hypothetical protein ASG29_03585 [Sphingomonas sp. Leaf412]|uniref:FAS1-like dehydratase domain-containing protein n=1 Tax=Sphingomonas sp. Leaf412 TaxID=1736370 RepID=UPI0006FADE3C|nr:MaoC family dehydratase N-terminal domain-containing protein [Sphingomonas sp. Leaf412]KQT35207.1 hypothetical protein ASG29_03585 [Sphingomonas sp. Leaf412]
MDDDDAPRLEDWIGSQQVCDDPLAPFPAQALGAVLGRREVGDMLPLPWHWLYAIVPPAPGATGVDGHPARGGFLPPVPLPRRMWAGSDIAIARPLHLGTPARRTSTVADVRRKDGRSGPLVFVTVEHVWTQGDAICLTERQDIVYRDVAPLAGTPVAPPPEPIDPAPVRATSTPDAVMLFRYSALTHNAHRIHYDLPYATDAEGYPGLVVHGPLIATMLIDAATPLVDGRRPVRFSFRAQRPAFAGQPLRLCARADGPSLSLWSVNADGHVGVRATLELASE